MRVAPCDEASCFGGLKEQGTGGFAAEHVQHIQRDDMGGVSLMFRENEPGDDSGMFGNDAVGAFRLQVHSHFPPSVGDAFRKANLIDGGEGVEIGRLVGAKKESGRRHGSGSQFENHGKN